PHLEVHHRLGVYRVEKINGSLLDLVTVVGEKDFAAGKVRTAKDHRDGGRADNAQVCIAAQAYLAADQVHLAGGLHGDIELHSLRERTRRADVARFAVELRGKGAEIEVGGKRDALDFDLAAQQRLLHVAREGEVGRQQGADSLRIAHANLVRRQRQMKLH